MDKVATSPHLLSTLEDCINDDVLYKSTYTLLYFTILSAEV